jgi:hypothetical protein
MPVVKEDEIKRPIKTLLSGLLSGLLRRTAPLLESLARVHAHASLAVDLRQPLPASVVVQGGFRLTGADACISAKMCCSILICTWNLEPWNWKRIGGYSATALDRGAAFHPDLVVGGSNFDARTVKRDLPHLETS